MIPMPGQGIDTVPSPIDGIMTAIVPDADLDRGDPGRNGFSTPESENPTASRGVFMFMAAAFSVR